MFQAFIALICPISFPVILNQRFPVPIIIEVSMVLFCDDEIDEAFLEFRRESCKSAASSSTIVREILTVLRRGTNTIEHHLTRSTGEWMPIILVG